MNSKICELLDIEFPLVALHTAEMLLWLSQRLEDVVFLVL